MNPVNRVLSPFGLRLTKADTVPPPEVVRRHARELESFEKDPRGWKIASELCHEAGEHPSSYVDRECEFAARHVARIDPAMLLDIGSYRWFVLGMLSSRRVTTIDVRPRLSQLGNERLVSCDAKSLTLPSASFDAVTTLCAVEHFGLGRYGDELDRDADKRAIAEMARVLKPGGRLILTTTITRGEPTIVHNAHRIYSIEKIRELTRGFAVEDESCFSFERGAICGLDGVTSAPLAFDVYMGCLRKSAPTASAA